MQYLGPAANDGAMVHALTLLHDVAAGRPPYDFVDADRRAKASVAVTRGIDCILRTQIKQDGKKDGWVKTDPTAGPLWARFYELGTHRPIFIGRDKIVRYALSEIERERRGGYDFYGDWAETLLAKDHPRWVARHKINQEQRQSKPSE